MLGEGRNEKWLLMGMLFFIILFFIDVWKMKVKVAQWCPTLCDQARILEWVAFPFSRGSSQPRGQTQVSCIASRFFTNWTIREAPKKVIFTRNFRSNLYRMTQWSLFLFTRLRCLMNAAEFTSSLQRMNKKILFFLRWTGSSHKESSMTDINMVGFPGGFLSQQSKTFCWFQPHLAKTSHINNSDNYGEINCYFILIL